MRAKHRFAKFTWGGFDHGKGEFTFSCQKLLRDGPDSYGRVDLLEVFRHYLKCVVALGLDLGAHGDEDNRSPAGSIMHWRYV